MFRHYDRKRLERIFRAQRNMRKSSIIGKMTLIQDGFLEWVKRNSMIYELMAIKRTGIICTGAKREDLKRRGLIVYDRSTKRWNVTAQGLEVLDNV